MIIGIGNDIVQHGLNTKMLEWDAEGNFPKRILSDYELTLYQNQPTDNFIAGRFAAKEAILKCLRTGMRDGISLKDINIVRSDSGQPEVQLSGEVKRIAEDSGINKWHISITHSEAFSLAFAIAERI